MGKLIVYSASAGSGKTHKIVGSYISMLFSGENAYKHILAVTFTNKAGEEMKSRIIKELNKIASGNSSDYLDEIMKKYQISELEVRTKAGTIFKQILHDYSGFSISTIDSFFQKILKGFAYETGIQYNYEIELNSANLINQVVDNLIVSATDLPSLRSSLIELINQNILEGKKWDTRMSLKNFLKEIYKSEYRKYQDDYERLFQDTDNLKQFVDSLARIISEFDSKIAQFTNDLQSILDKYSLVLDDFKGKSRSSVLRRMLNIITEIQTKDTDSIFNNFDDTKAWLTKADLTDDLKCRCTEELIEKCKQMRSHIDSDFSIYYTAGLVRRQMYFIAIVGYAFSEISRYKNENNKFMINEVPAFLSEIAKNNNSSFIYEKIGSFYRNYLIDEFQDTSRVQWEAFLPLISESLSMQNDYNTNILVGDVKQSIYAWRGGDWELLAEQIKNDFPYWYKEIPLNENYRSAENIVDFNNSFFNISAEKLQHDYNLKNKQENNNLSSKITEIIYNEAKQTKIRREEGYVEINVLKKDKDSNDADIKEVSMSIMINQIENLQKNNHSAGDIMILVRSNADGQKIADYILNYSLSPERKEYCNYDVISADSLFVSGNEAVCFIIACLKYIADENNKNACAQAAYLLFRLGLSGKQEFVELSINKYVAEFQAKMSDFKENFVSYPLSELVERLINLFGLGENKIHVPFITSFSDIIHDYSIKYPADINGFLEWWEEFGAELTLKIPENQNAINIITAHKSKGLAADFVFVPFCDWSLINYSGIVWCNIDKEPFNILPAWPLNFNNSLSKSLAVEQFDNERFRKVVESFNIMYVAFTRARKGLFVNSGVKDVSDKGFQDIGQLLFSALNSPNFIKNYKFNIEDLKERNIIRFNLGIIPEIIRKDFQNNYFDQYPVYIPKKKPIIKSFIDDLDNAGSKIYLLKKGIIYHKIFENIQHLSELDSSVEKLILKGIIRKSESEAIVTELNAILMNPIISEWFDGTYTVLNEAEIFCGNTQIRRPDRIMYDSERLIVLDYKFGENQTQAHINQVVEYGDLLSQMDERKPRMFLWYVFLNKLVEVISKDEINELSL